MDAARFEAHTDKATRRRFGPRVLAFLLMGMACALAAAIAAAPASAQGAGTGSISGTVTDGTTSDPVEGVCVYATDTVNQFQTFGTDVSGPGGTYEITGLADRDYKVVFTDDAPPFCSGAANVYDIQWWDGETSISTADVVTITGGSAETGKDAALVPTVASTGSVSGVLTDAVTNAPIAGACVALLDPDNQSAIMASDFTDATGGYSLANLADRSYKLIFTNSASLCPGGTSTHVTEFWQDKSSFAAADLVTVSGGGALTRDAELAPAGGGGGGSGTISGRVTDMAETPAGVEDICVGVVSTGMFGMPLSATTDANGDYEITNVPAGSYRVSFTPCGDQNLVAEYYNDAANTTSAQTVSVASGADVEDIDAALAEGATISGHVTDSEAPPADLEGICVDAASASAMPTMDLGTSGNAVTDAQGEYTIKGLRAGSYKVEFTPCGGAMPGDPEPPNVAPEYFDGAADWNGATPVELAAGEDRGGVDASMEAAATISGRVTDSSGATPLQGICVITGTSLSGPFSSATTNADGEYTITGLRAGAYKVQFSACSSGHNVVTEYYDGAATVDAGDEIPLTAGETRDDIDATMDPGATISGQVTDSAATPNPQGFICVNLQTPTGSGVASTTTSASGNYTLTGLRQGNYKVQFQPCMGQNLLTEYYDGAADPASAQTIALTTGENRTGVNASLEPGATISGTVTDSGAPPSALSGICVSAVSTTGSPPASGNATTGPSGQYTIQGLRPGAYTVRFGPCFSFPGGPPAANYIAEYYDGSPTPEGATAITLGAGESRTGVDASLVPGATISGRVTDSDTPANDVAGACVSVSSASGTGVQSTFAGTDGTYTVNGLPPGSYVVHFSACAGGNLMAEYYSGAAERDDATVITLTTGETRANVDASLEEGATISGRVTDDAATPGNLANVCVTADSGATVEFAQTNASGQYTIDGLRPGSYEVYFEPCYDPFSPYPNVLPEWYDGATDEGSATPVPVSGGEAKTGIDASMRPGARISGNVQYEGDPAEWVCVDAIPADSTLEPPDPFGRYIAATDEDGDYTIIGLAAGDYKLRFSDCAAPLGTIDFATEFWNDKATFEAADTVTVPEAGHVTGKDAVVADGPPAPTPGATIGNATVTEGNSGTTAATFAVTLDEAPADEVTVEYATADGTATQPADYAGETGTVTFAAGDTSEQVAVEVEGDTLDEADETFEVALSDPDGVAIDDGTGAGTITDDDAQPAISIADTSVAEGDTGTTAANFAVTLNNPSGREVTVAYATANGSATQPGDYAQKSGTVTFAPGDVSEQVSVDVKGDGDHEANETFEVNLSSPQNATIADGKGIGTITNDDPDTTAPNTFITSGPSGQTDATSAAFTFTANESATFECGLVEGGGPVTTFTSCASPRAFNDLEPGQHTFAVRAKDPANNTDATPAERSWTIVAEPVQAQTSAGTVPDGEAGTVSSDPEGTGPTAENPVTTAVEVPSGGNVTITEEPAAPSNPTPQGFTLVDQQVDIVAPPATPAAPLRLTFVIDGSKLAGVDRSRLTVLRNGSPARDCAAGATTVSDQEDFCILAREDVGSDTPPDFRMTVLTAHASEWNFAVKPQPTNPGGGDPGGGTTDPGGGTTNPGGGNTDPGGGNTDPGGSTPEAPGCVVPKLKGLKLGAAKAALEKAGCKLGKITKRKVKKPKPGTVLSQSPAAGDELPANSPVNVTVSQKKKKKK